MSHIECTDSGVVPQRTRTDPLCCVPLLLTLRELQWFARTLTRIEHDVNCSAMIVVIRVPRNLLLNLEPFLESCLLLDFAPKSSLCIFSLSLNCVLLSCVLLATP